MSQPEAVSLIERAIWFKYNTNYPIYSQKSLANLFYENSTRTRVSFELAAKHLGLHVINLDVQRSSETKGEIIGDTIKTLAAMGVNLAVIRHGENGLPQQIAEQAPTGFHLINAGDGTATHPTQAMLDFMTILEQKPRFPDLKIAIVGNLKHSRVAHSLQAMCQLFQIRELKLVAPEPWFLTTPGYGQMTTSLQQGLEDADVVVTLRVQQERFQAADHLDLTTYRQQYALTQATLKWVKPDAIIMHPGPMNRGVEIDSDVADGAQSSILEQVKNGVFMRMAIIEHLLLQS